MNTFVSDIANRISEIQEVVSILLFNHKVCPFTALNFYYFFAFVILTISVLFNALSIKFFLTTHKSRNVCQIVDSTLLITCSKSQPSIWLFQLFKLNLFKIFALSWHTFIKFQFCMCNCFLILALYILFLSQIQYDCLSSTKNWRRPVKCLLSMKTRKVVGFALSLLLVNVKKVRC